MSEPGVHEDRTSSNTVVQRLPKRRAAASDFRAGKIVAMIPIGTGVDGAGIESWGVVAPLGEYPGIGTRGQRFELRYGVQHGMLDPRDATRSYARLRGFYRDLFA
ncbi:MAG TPA: hypothetical protein VHV78_02890 [Gemmatimonadaceae bacterium]|nr:hypothetical protein [Gemmatimonadaceae bacterium]